MFLCTKLSNDGMILLTEETPLNDQIICLVLSDDRVMLHYLHVTAKSLFV